MGHRHSWKAAVLPILLFAGVALFQPPGRTQEPNERVGRRTAPRHAPDQSGIRATDAATSRLGLRLWHLRMIGDLEKAGRVFRRLFPPEETAGPETAVKLADARVSNRVEGAPENTKPITADADADPVFFSPEHEKNPSADLWRSASGDDVIVLAAEQWAGGWPKDIRVRKSSDSGRTWPDTVAIGDGRPWTRPSLRRVSDGAIGMAFVKDWNGRDRDIYFARLSEDLASDAEFPVAFSSLDQSSPSVATDFPVFAAPYVYVVYAENEGPVRSVKFRVSDDLGAAWSRAVTLASFPGGGAPDPETAIAFDHDTRALHVAYTCSQGPSGGIAVTTSLDFGASWSLPVHLTPADGCDDLSPKIAAGGGLVVAVFEHADRTSGRTIGLACSLDSGRSWTTDGRLAFSPAAGTSPDVRASESKVSPGFFASYVEDGTRIIVASLAASDPVAWTIVNSYDEGVSAVDGGPVVVLPMADALADESAGAIWSRRNPDYDIFFGPAGIPGDTFREGVLSLLPTSGLSSSGIEGGPFTPAGISYTLRNAGRTPLAWMAENTAGWVTLSASSGTLGPGESAAVEVALNESACSLPADAYGDTIIFTNLTNGRGTTTRTVTLPISLATLTVNPANREVPYTAGTTTFSVVKTGAGKIAWTAAVIDGASWLSITSGAEGTNSGTITAAFTENADPASRTGTIRVTPQDDTTSPIDVTVTQAGASLLTLTPADGLASAGATGGPFSPSSKDFTLQNDGGAEMSWTASATEAWLTISPASGTLAAGTSATITVLINAEANSLGEGTYDDAVSFTSPTDEGWSASRPVSLMVSATAGALSVSPAEGLTSSGPVGGPFTPESRDYTLLNTGTAPITWTASNGQAWTTLSATSGTLGSGGSTTVTVSINTWANALSAGTFSDAVSFKNTKNGSGDTTRTVALTVSLGPALSVTPDSREVTGIAGTTTFDVSNTGGGTMPWTAAVIAGGDWLALRSGASGTDGGTITAGFTDNRTGSSRVAIIRVTAPGAAGSPRDVTVTQIKGSISLGLSGQRLAEKAWIIQREYGHLTVAVGNPTSIPVDKYVIYRKAGNQDVQILAELAGSTVAGSAWVYNDTFLQSGTSYMYRVTALDALGNVIGESNDVTI